MMRKLNKASIGLFAILATCLYLFSCQNDKDNYPQDYVGFEKKSLTVECNRDQAEKTLEVKIKASEKSREDRTVQLSTPPSPHGVAEIMRLTEQEVIIKAGQKSTTTIVKIYPKRMVLKQQSVIISCTPQWKEGKISKMNILLKQH